MEKPADIVRGVATCLMACVLPLVAACDSHSRRGIPALPDEETPEETTLCLNIEQIGMTKAAASTVPDNEKMHSVRIIILHPDGTVEHNRCYPLVAAQTNKLVMLKVKTGEKKKMYLFANEESVTAVQGVAGAAAGGSLSLTEFFDSYSPDGTGGTVGTGDFATDIDALYFAPEYTAPDGSFLPIPMSSVYDIEVPEVANFEGTFYVVRVATKFKVCFFNWRGDDVLVDNVGLESHARRNYLMAHVEDTERNDSLLIGYDTWMDWLQAMANASNVTSWLTDYTLPAGETSTTAYTSPDAILVPKTDGKKAGTAEHVFYLPESKRPKGGATAGEQEYIMTIHITDINAGTFECPLIEPDVQNPLNALFRNTQVVVNVELLDHSIKVSVDVMPYTAVELRPQFGLTTTTPTTPS